MSAVSISRAAGGSRRDGWRHRRGSGLFCFHHLGCGVGTRVKPQGELPQGWTLTGQGPGGDFSREKLACGDNWKRLGRVGVT